MSGYSISNTAGGISCICFDHFTETGLIDHAFTTRLGGVSKGPYSSLNWALHVGDDIEAVLENRKRVCSLWGADLGDMVSGQQVHGDVVYTVTEADRGRGASDVNGAIPGSDALITNRPGILLSSYYADCVPVMILDPLKKVISLVHAGWRGTVMRIAATSIKTMSTIFGTNPGDCLVSIAPSIGFCCYEIDRPVIKAFTNQGFNLEPYIKQSGSDRWKIDLQHINRCSVIEAGVKPDRVTVAELCTSCNPGMFFSFRGQSGRCGRMASLMALKN